MRTAVCVFPALLAGAAAMFVSCADNPSGPSSLPPALTAELHMSVPSEIEPGEVVQVRLTLRRGDRAVEDVTDRASWASGDTSVLALTPTALATGVKPGESRISAAYEGRTASAQVLVLPRGTYRLVGVIRDAEGAVLSGVTITALSGDASGQTARSRADGGYAVYGLKGLVRIGLSRPGYFGAEHEVDVVGHMTQNFSMTLDGPPTKFNGRYNLTISAANGCPSGFPSDAARRTYTAELSQQAEGIMVTLHDRDFLPHTDVANQTRGDRFWGYAAPDGRSAWFIIGDDFYYPSPGAYGIAERFGDTALLIEASGTGRGTTDRIEGTLAGSIYIGGSTTPPFEPIRAECSGLRFELTKQ